MDPSSHIGGGHRVVQCQILAIGQKMPGWAVAACEEYFVRLQRFMKCALLDIPSATRQKNVDVESYKEEEGLKLLQKIAPTDKVIALDVKGQAFSTTAIAQNIASWQQEGNKLVFLIGGPDGLSNACLKRANVKWSLSALTFPHTLARVILLEQLYRASSLLANHPYHRE